MYNIHRIPKLSNQKVIGWRILEEPDKELKERQKKIVKTIQEKVQFLSCVHGIKDTSINTNSNSHIQKRIIYKIDLKDYFHTVTIDKIQKIIEKYHLDISINDVSYEGRLPTGAPTSPIIANLAFEECDKSILSLIKDKDISYTRYMDDLTFSTNKLEDLNSNICISIREIITGANFIINYKKSGIQFNFQQQKVTGIVVNNKANLPKFNRYLLRAKLDHYAKLQQDKLSSELEGELAFVNSIDKGLANKYRNYYTKRCKFYNGLLHI